MKFTPFALSKRPLAVCKAEKENPSMIQNLYADFVVNAILVESAGNLSGSDNERVASLLRPRRLFRIFETAKKRYDSLSCVNCGPVPNGPTVLLFTLLGAVGRASVSNCTFS